jgi:1-acyl-sn-glycerol-3-phosphate acyltransferase
MLVANHLSWLDIFAINALATSAFVAKAELRRWPVAGWLAAMAGTVFIERARRHAVHQVIERLRQRIRERFPVAVFPEATTSSGESLLPFYGNLFEAAIAEGAPIIPIALRYRDASGAPAPQAAYVGDTTFVESLWMVLGARGLVVEVHILPAVQTTGRNRHELARELRSRISARLGLPTADTAPGTAVAFQAASR